MPYKPVILDDSFTRTEPGRSRVPQGYYLGEVARLEPTAESYDKTPGYTFQFRILEGPAASPAAGRGREIPRYGAMSERAQFGVAGILGALGQGDLAKAIFTQYGGKPLPYDTFVKIGRFIESKTKGGKVILMVGNEMSPQGREFSSVLEIGAYTAEDWAAKRQENLVGGINGTGAGVPGGAVAAAPTASLADQVSAMFEQPDVN
jgi:hypothetical protein